jgi:putative transposase
LRPTSTAIALRHTGRGFRQRQHSRRYHESLNNMTPADVYFPRGQTILARRENIKLKTIELRRRLHRSFAATSSTQMSHILSKIYC